jgi:hypothetical protein
MSGDQPDYLIRLRPVAHSGPVISRLRMFLKAALRAWGLRAIEAVEVPRDAPRLRPHGVADMPAARAAGEK